MAAKLITVVAALVTIAHCSVVPVAYSDTDYTSFAYNIADHHTGDYKSQIETRVGGTVQGQYSLLDADGTRRTVDYTVDDVNGFNAAVRKDAGYKSTPVVADAPTFVAARTVAAPIISAPIVSRTLTAPTVVASPSMIAARTVESPTVVSGLKVIAARTIAAPTVYASTPNVRTFADRLGTRPTVFGTRTLTTPTVYAGSAANIIAGHTFTTPTVYSASAPIVLGSHTLTTPTVYAASAPNVVARTIGTPSAYAASAPLVAHHSIVDPSVYGTVSTGPVVAARTVSSFNSPITYW